MIHTLTPSPRPIDRDDPHRYVIAWPVTGQRVAVQCPEVARAIALATATVASTGHYATITDTRFRRYREVGYDPSTCTPSLTPWRDGVPYVPVEATSVPVEAR